MTGRRAVLALLVAFAFLTPLAAGVTAAPAHTRDVAHSAPPPAAAPAVAEAGSRVPSAALVAPAEPPVSAWIVVLALAASLALARRRPRRALALGLVVVLLIFAFGSAVHSAHHHDGPDRAGQCPVASAAAHAPGDLVPVVDVAPASVAAALGDVPLDDRGPATRVICAVRGRAPPFLA